MDSPKVFYRLSPYTIVYEIVVDFSFLSTNDTEYRTIVMVDVEESRGNVVKFHLALEVR